MGAPHPSAAFTGTGLLWPSENQGRRWRSLLRQESLYIQDWLAHCLKSHPLRKMEVGCLLDGSVGGSSMREAVSDYLKSYKEEIDALKPRSFPLETMLLHRRGNAV